MENTATGPVGDYKKLYEESLLIISKKRGRTPPNCLF